MELEKENKEKKLNENKKENNNKSSSDNNEVNKEKEKDKKFLNKKTKRFKNKSKNKNKKKNKKINNNNFKNRTLEPIEQLYQKAKNLYEKKSESYDLDKIDYSQKVNKEKRWTHDILQKGTYDDKISALLLYIRQNPKMTLKYLEILIRLAENKNKRRNDGVIVGLKDLFLESILDNKKYLPFNQKYNNKNKEGLNNINEDELINSFYEDKIHHLYLRFINILEYTVNNESIINIKKKNLDYLYEMLVKKPESEEKILQDIVNKLGDTSNEVSNYTMKLLKQIQEQHMNMSTIIFKYVTTFYSMNKKNEAKLCALNFMVQMEIPHGHNKAFLEESIDFFFNLFNQISSESENSKNNISEKDIKNEKNKKKLKKKKKMYLEILNQNSINEKFLSLIVKRINILFKYVKRQQKQMEKINEIIHEKISVLFKLSHNKSLKLSIEILKLLFGIITTQDQNFVDRYYKSLYELISNSSLSSSKYVKEALKLILVSLMFDNNNNRICSFMKRLLEMSLMSEPQYIICILIIVSQVLRNKNKLWKMLEREQTKINVFYDPMKRDPQFAQGEHSFLNELYLLQKHYHPSVQRMAKFILENYNKEIISYDGDPLMDFSLINFLEKFMLKNPKIKKEIKEKKVIENDDDELKKFLKEDEDENDKNNNNENDIYEKNENDFQFIEKFNKIYPEITNSKNYLKKLKKKEKKSKNEDDIDDIIDEKDFDQNKEDEDIEKFADKVIDDEYKKFGKDIDDDDLGDYKDESEEGDDKENEEEIEEEGEEEGEGEEGEEIDDDNIDNEENEEIEDLFTEDENEDNNEDNEEDDGDDLEEEENEDNKNNNKGKKKNKESVKEKVSGFVDAETYYKSLKNKNKKKKIK